MASKYHALLKHTIFLLAVGLALSGCVDRISTLGAQYYTDTIGTYTSIRNDPAFMQFADTVRPFVTANGIDYALNDSTTLMVIGKVSNPYPSDNDNMESWGLLQFPPLFQDTVDKIIGVRLILKDQNFKYGDTTSSLASTIRYSVYTCFGKVTDTTSAISMLDLNQPAIGTIDTVFPDLLDSALVIPIDGVKPNLTASTLGFVVIPTPGQTMTNCRGFGTIHSYGDVNSIPRLELILNDGTTIYETPTVDFHIVHDMNVAPTGEFSLRGSAGIRERINLNISNPADTTDKQLDPLTTINNATLVLHLDPANSSHSNLSGDTIGPDAVQLGLVDSGGHYDSNGSLDSNSATNTTYHFQVRGIIQNWLRDTTQNKGFELRAGYITRDFDAAAPEAIGVEDYTVNRWTFYGPNCSDLTKRPYIILSYSKLK